MDLGIETIGNATLVVHDGGPVLATDPWVRGSAYFGSWGLSHEIPPAQEASILGAGAVWFSHGHPDHLNPASLPLFYETRILLPDHVGGRIAADLARDGYRVEVLPDNQWVRISDRVRVLCIADVGQDAVLLVDVGGRLVVNLNDAQDRGWGPLVKRVITRVPTVAAVAAQRLRRCRHDQLRRRGRRPGAEPGTAAPGERLRGRGRCRRA